MYANTEKPLEMCFLEVSSSLDKGGQSKDFGGKTAIKCCTNCFFFPKIHIIGFIFKLYRGGITASCVRYKPLVVFLGAISANGITNKFLGAPM